VLSKEEIAELAARSQAIRDSRRRPTGSAQLARPPAEERPRKVKFDDRNDYYSSEEDDSDRSRDRDRDRDYKSPSRASRSHVAANTLKNAQPNPIIATSKGSAPNYGPPYMSPRSVPPQHSSPPPQYTSPMWVPAPRQDYYGNGGGVRQRGIDEKPKKEKERRRFRDLTAAGIGGAAVSLLNVLTEAAEAL